MSQAILPEPPEELKQLSHQLCERIRQEITATEFVSFARFMERVLYEPGLGYYSAGLHKFGASGDFVTAPELGQLFAGCIAGQLKQVAGWLDDYEILELGAGSGKLAADLLNTLDPACIPRRYRILERSADLRATQRETIQQHAPRWVNRVEWLDHAPRQSWNGVVLANEVIDAMAVERFRLNGSAVEQAGVAPDGDHFSWCYRPAPPELAAAVQRLDLAVPDGYVSEINLALTEWLRAVSSALRRGLVLFVDYGYARHEYYRPERRDGTLICHYRHRAHDDVFFWPGLQDLTAFVDFTALAEAADACGLEVAGYASQAMFLLACGLESLLQTEPTGEREELSDDPQLELNAEARQLTLPGMMGERFQAMALTRGLEKPLRGFSMQDLRYRL